MSEEQKVIEAVKTIKEYCYKQIDCNDCKYNYIGCKDHRYPEDWIIEE